jgi:hypothetical protein
MYIECEDLKNVITDIKHKVQNSEVEMSLLERVMKLNDEVKDVVIPDEIKLPEMNFDSIKNIPTLF